MLTKFFSDNPELEFEVEESKFEQLSDYLALLQAWTTKIDLVSPAPDKTQIERHIIDSLSSAAVFQKPPIFKADSISSLIDVGSGAGLPGIVWGIVMPELKVYLLEPREKRVHFLREVIRRLDLKNFEIVRERVEEYTPEHKFDYATARAFGKRDFLFNELNRLLKPGGCFVDHLGKEELNIQGDKISEDFERLSTTSFNLNLSKASRKVVIWQKIYKS